MPNLGDKFCYVSQDVESFATIVKSSYEATKHDTCLKLGFVPIELVSQDATGCVVRVPGALRNSISGCYTWVITHASPVPYKPLKTPTTLRAYLYSLAVPHTNP